MNIKRLQAKNLFAFKELSLDFSDLNFALFKGKSGSGKSSVFDIILWTLFGITARKKYSKKKIIYQSTDDTKTFGIAKLNFEISKINYTVVRRIGNVEKLKIFKQGELLGDFRTVTQAQDELKKILRFDADVLLNIAYFSQDDYGFALSDSTQRVNILSDIFGLGVYEEAAKFSQAAYKDLERQFAINSGSQNSIPSDEIDLPNIWEKMNDLKKRYRTIKDQLSIVAEKMEQAKAYYDLHEQVQLAHSQAENCQLNLNAILQTKKIKIENVQHYILSSTVLSKSKKRLEELHSEIKALPDPVILNTNLLKVKQNLQKLGQRQAIIFEKNRANEKMISEYENVDNLIGQRCIVCKQEVGANAKQHAEIELRKLLANQEVILEKSQKIDEDLEAWKNKHWKIQNELRQTNDILALLLEEQAKLTNELKHHQQARKNIVEIESDFSNPIKEAREAYNKKFQNYQNIRIKWAELSESLRFDEDKLSQENSRLRLEMSEIDRQFAIFKDRKTAAEKLLSRKRQYEKQALQIQSQLQTADYCSQAFKLIRLQLLKKVIPILEYEANYFLQRLFPGTSVSFDIDLEKSQNKFDMWFKDEETGIVRELFGWSGGQRNRFCIAIYLALNKISALASGRSINFLILDEKLFGFDPETMNSVIEFLQAEVGNQRKIWVVSHDERLESNFSQVLNFYMDKHISYYERII